MDGDATYSVKMLVDYRNGKPPKRVLLKDPLSEDPNAIFSTHDKNEACRKAKDALLIYESSLYWDLIREAEVVDISDPERTNVLKRYVIEGNSILEVDPDGA